MNYTECFNRLGVGGLQLVLQPVFAFVLSGCIRRRASGLCRLVVACGCLAASGGVQVACVGLWLLVAAWLHP